MSQEQIPVVPCNGPSLLGLGSECQRCGATYPAKEGEHGSVCAHCQEYGAPQGCDVCGKHIL